MTRWVLSILMMAAVSGCASTPPATSKGPHAQCLVCKHNADLACVDVTVDGQTPRCVCEGETYYFCSDDCRKTFENNPTKYLSHGK